MIFFNLLLYFIFFFLVDFGGISIACVAGYCYLSIQTSRTDPKITPLRLHLQPHLTSSALALQPHLVHHLLIFTSPPSLIAFFFFSLLRLASFLFFEFFHRFPLQHHRRGYLQILCPTGLGCSSFIRNPSGSTPAIHNGRDILLWSSGFVPVLHSCIPLRSWFPVPDPDLIPFYTLIHTTLHIPILISYILLTPTTTPLGYIHISLLPPPLHPCSHDRFSQDALCGHRYGPAGPRFPKDSRKHGTSHGQRPHSNRGQHGCSPETQAFSQDPFRQEVCLYPRGVWEELLPC